jgi:leucyl-tRNA synthetase/predicted alpha/beta hydrolase family esterase
MLAYDHKTIEEKWIQEWIDKKIYSPNLESSKSPFYNLMMFPYPSAEGLHVGNMYAFTGADVFGRYQRMKGHDVFQPIGLDGFGIHSENYAIKVGKHPAEQAKISQERFYKQLSRIGNGFAWDHRLETYDPDYYKWTQWLFAEMFNKGLAYRKKASVNWCPSCKTVLSDEQVEDGKCERCKNETTRKETEQWFFRITRYADRLLSNIEKIDWPSKIKIAQRQWIGKSKGLSIDFAVQDLERPITVWTKFWETVFGTTFLVVAPEHWSVEKRNIPTTHKKIVADYIASSLAKSEQERKEGEGNKTGVFTGLYAINPANERKVPIWVADYVLKDVGTAAVMGVPAHDERDFAFAKKFDLPIQQVVSYSDEELNAQVMRGEIAHEGQGILMNSGSFDGLSAWEEGKEKMAAWMIEKGFASWETTYHLRDWLISRQRYWGPPIPMVHCDACAKKKPKVFIAHGTWGSGEGNWFPWLEKHLSQFDVRVARPTLPDSRTPNYEERMSYIDSEFGDFIDEDTIVIGHSSGSATALHVAERKKVKQIILVSPIISIDTEYKDKLSSFFDEKTGQALYDLYNRPVDMAKIKYNSGPITVLFSDDDPYLPKSFIDEAKNLYGSSNVFTLHAGGHLSSQYVHGFWELLSYLPMNEIEMTGWSAIPENELPLLLPELSDYKPTGDGKAPLEKAGEEFLYTICPKCGGKAKRETDVSDTFLDSSWYFLRYPSILSKDSNDNPWNENITETWLPVDKYIGGAEHAVLHLLYSRFVWMALQDWGYIPPDLGDEPFPSLFSHGLIIKDGAKMSKSRGNVVVPDDYIAKYGADTLRMYLMFLGSYDQGGDFRDSGIAGMYRFLSKIWEAFHDESMVSGTQTTPDLESKLHETIRKMDHDIAAFKYNTAIAALMELFNTWKEPNAVMSISDSSLVLKLLAPFAPFMSEQLWQVQSKSGENKAFRSVHLESFPVFDKAKILSKGILIVVQVNGKKRAEVLVSGDTTIDQVEVLELARTAPGIDRWLSSPVRKEIFIPPKGERQGIVNFVI